MGVEGGGGVKAVNVGGGGSRLKGPAGQPGQLNGMPSKKSHSTSKLPGKGEQGNYQTERESCSAGQAGPGETVGWRVIISLLLTDGEGEDCDWVAPHQNTVSHVDPHAPLAGLPPGEGNAPLPPSFLPLTSHLAPEHHCRLQWLSQSVSLSVCSLISPVSPVLYWLLDVILTRNISTLLLPYYTPPGLTTIA